MEWQAALDETKSEIEKRKAELQANHKGGTEREERAQPAQQAADSGANSPLLCGLLAQLLEAVGNVNPKASQITEQIRTIVGQSH